MILLWMLLVIHCRHGRRRSVPWLLLILLLRLLLVRHSLSTSLMTLTLTLIRIRMEMMMQMLLLVTELALNQRMNFRLQPVHHFHQFIHLHFFLPR